MALAILYPEPAKGGRGRKLSQNQESLGIAKKTWENSVSQARAVLRHTPELAEKVRDGFPLSEAFAMIDADASTVP